MRHAVVCVHSAIVFPNAMMHSGGGYAEVVSNAMRQKCMVLAKLHLVRVQAQSNTVKHNVDDNTVLMLTRASANNGIAQRHGSFGCLHGLDFTKVRPSQKSIRHKVHRYPCFCSASVLAVARTQWDKGLLAQGHASLNAVLNVKNCCGCCLHAVEQRASSARACCIKCRID